MKEKQTYLGTLFCLISMVTSTMAVITVIYMNNIDSYMQNHNIPLNFDTMASCLAVFGFVSLILSLFMQMYDRTANPMSIGILVIPTVFLVITLMHLNFIFI